MNQSQLRIARTDSSGVAPLSVDPDELRARLARLQRVIRRHLPGVTASVLAQPHPVPESNQIDWYSDLAGQPTPLLSLPADEQAAARALLADRLASINKLADELPRLAPEDTDIAETLRQATSYPDDARVYVIGGEPVLTFWGYASAAQAARPAAAGGAAGAGKLPVAWLALALLLAASAVGGWLWFDQQREQALLAALNEALSAECDPMEPLTALNARLEELDPDGGRYPDIGKRAAAETGRCTAAQQLEQDLELAAGDCDGLAELADALEGRDLKRQPFRGLHARLTSELVVCERAQSLSSRLDANLGICPELLRIDGRVAGLDTSRPPLDAVRERLDWELDLCAKAERFSQALAGAQTDCTALRKLDAEMHAEDSSREPLASVRTRLDKALEACESLDELEQALQDALGDCRRLAALGKRLDEDEGLRHNPMVVDVKRGVSREMKVCELAQAREQMLFAAMGDCKALDKLKSKLAVEPGADARLGQLSTRLDKALAKCRVPVVAKAPASTPEPKTAAEPRPPKQTGSKPIDTRKLCPGERPVELAPDLVIVFDASGSMGQPMSLDGQLADAIARGGGAIGAVIGGLAKMQGGETRIDVAKKATNGIVGALPNDVDVGLVLVEQCNQARPVGFYSPKQRKQLMNGVYGIQPVRGTPLASGIAKAASMVDGVRSPATIVVISDGKESCNGNPCAVAASIAKRKPMLTINVVDIMGTGAGTCAARATGGRVFAARNAAQLKSMLGRATAEVRGPANCRKK